MSGNGDGVVSVADVTVVAAPLAARGSSRIEDVTRDVPGATVAADGNGDGFVDAGDLSRTVGKLFGS